jgi:hypothetical protein
MAAAKKKERLPSARRSPWFPPLLLPQFPPHPFRASQFSFAQYSPHVCRARWVEVVDERCEQGQGRPGRRRCSERAGHGESSRSERSTRPRWPCCSSRSAAAAAATALIRGGACQALAAAECRASSFSWRSGHGWLVPLDARGVRPRARMRAHQGRRRRGRRRPTTTVTNVHEGALVLDVLVLDRRFIQRPLRLLCLPLRSKRASKSVFCRLQEQEVGKAAAFCPCKPNGKKMRSLFDAQKKRRKKMRARERESPVSEKKRGGEGEKTKTLSLFLSPVSNYYASRGPARPQRSLFAISDSERRRSSSCCISICCC